MLLLSFLIVIKLQYFLTIQTYFFPENTSYAQKPQAPLDYGQI